MERKWPTQMTAKPEVTRHESILKNEVQFLCKEF